MSWPTWLGGAAFGNSVGILGTIVSLVLFFFQVRGQIDARREKITHANADLVGSIIKRLAIDKKPFQAVDFESFRTARAHESGLKSTTLVTFELALSCAFKELMNNPYLDISRRDEVYDLVMTSKGSQVTASDVENPLDSARDLAPSLVMAAGTSIIIGMGASALALFFKEGHRAAQPSGLGGVSDTFPLLFLIIGGMIIAIVVATQIMFRSKERPVFKPTLDVSFMRDLDRRG